jgi:hypothetical protein
MRYKVGDWVFRFIGRFQSPYLCEIIRIANIEEGIFSSTKSTLYVLQVPKQEWQVYGSDNTHADNFVAKTQSELFAR